MIGIDIVEVDRLARSIQNPKFTARVFTAAESAYFNAKPSPAQSAAAIFCAKEAAAKALGTGISGGVLLKDIEIIHDSAGKPAAMLSGGALERLQKMGFCGAEISLSHSQNYACAVCVLVRD